MERLTEKAKDCFGYRLKDGSDAEVGFFKDYNAFYSHMMMVKALGEYEDLEDLIGVPMKDLAEILRQNIPEDCKHPHKAVVLTDDDVDRWHVYKNAEEQGLLLRLPCKVGDTIYHIWNVDDKPEIQEIKIETLTNLVAHMENGNFGKYIFLTQAEAEQKLKEMEGSHDEE